MTRQLFYLPVERYASRWTGYVSGYGGMFAEAARECGVEVETIAPSNEEYSISDGVVLDTALRAWFGFAQVKTLLGIIQSGEITNDSAIYVEDFWLPGMEMIPYACQLKGIRPKVYAFCHAQSVDRADFTHSMLPWIRYFETGWARWLTGIFVAAKELKQMLIQATASGSELDFGNAEKLVGAGKVHVTGTVFHRDTMVRMYPSAFECLPRKNQIVFASRFHAEKAPEFFVELAREIHEREELALAWDLVAVSGRAIPECYKQLLGDLNVEIRENVPKEEYLSILAQSKVSFNCAKQDFVGYVQLDALAMGCQVLLPDYLTFPDLVRGDRMYLYEPGNVCAALDKLKYLMSIELPPVGTTSPALYDRYGAKYERSVARMVDVMYREPTLGEVISAEREGRRV